VILLLIDDKELAVIGVRPGVSHRKHTALVMLQLVDDLVVEGLAVDALSPLPRPGGVAALDNELFDVPVENRVVIVAFGAEREEVLTSVRGEFAVQLNLQVSQIRVHSQRHMRSSNINIRLKLSAD